MRNLLIYSSLFIILLIMGGSSGSVSAHPIPTRESYIEQDTQHEQESYNLLELFSTCLGEIPSGYTHLTSDYKSYNLHLYYAKYVKKITPSLSVCNPNSKFHPYATLNKTKYYVFALCKIIV